MPQTHLIIVSYNMAIKTMEQALMQPLVCIILLIGIVSSKDDQPTGYPQLHDAAIQHAWPGTTIRTTIGQQASGVAMDKNNNLVVFHRGNKVWDDKYIAANGPIDVDVFMVIDPATNTIVDQWGAGMIYMPHGLTIDKDDNLWVTDVGAAQVLKIDGKTRKPSLVLGEKLVEGHDESHFCKPTTVAVASNGEFFVADGYCNARVMKFSSNGTLLTKWGKQTAAGVTNPGPYDLNLLHSLTLDETRDHILVADRENGRIQVYQAGLNGSVAGTYVRTYTPNRGSVFAITYDPIDDIIFVVNGPLSGYTKLEGYTINMQGTMVDLWPPSSGTFGQPHDLTFTRTRDKVNVYVGDVGLHQTRKLWQFESTQPLQPIVGK